MQCKRSPCQKEAAPGQAYCSRPCAPYGYLGTAPHIREQDILSAQTERSSTSPAGEVSGVSSDSEASIRPIDPPKLSSRERRKLNIDLAMSRRKEYENDRRPRISLYTPPKSDGETESGEPEMSRTRPENESDKRNGMQETKLLNSKESLTGDSSVALQEQSEVRRIASEEARSISMSSIDECSNKLLKLIESFGGQTNKNMQYQDVNAVCNCAKNVANLQRLKLEIIRVK